MEKPDKLKSALYKIVEAGEKYKKNRYTGTIKYHLKIVYRQVQIPAQTCHPFRNKVATDSG